MQNNCVCKVLQGLLRRQLNAVTGERLKCGNMDDTSLKRICRNRQGVYQLLVNLLLSVIDSCKRMKMAFVNNV